MSDNCWRAIAFIVLAAAPARAAIDRPEATFHARQAAELCEKGDYKASIKKGEDVLKAGFVSAEVHYNLGNAYLRTGQVGKAILAYRRAELLAPRDPDIRANLELARSRRRDKLDPRQPTKPVRAVLGVYYLLNLRELAVIFVIFVVVVAVLANAAVLRHSRRAGRLAALGLALVAALGVSLALKVHGQSGRREGVLLARKAEVRTGPGETRSAGCPRAQSPSCHSVYRPGRRREGNHVSLEQSGPLDVRIRPFRGSDTQSLMDITRAAFEGRCIEYVIERELGVIEDLAWDERKARGVRSEIASPHIAIQIAEADGRVAGYVTYEILHDQSAGWIRNIAVAPNAQSRGVGTKLIHSALAEFRAAGLKRIRIETLSSNEGARALYRRLGFSKVVERVYMYRDL